MAKILRYPATGKVVLDKEECVIDNTRGNKEYYYCHSHDVATGKYECPYADLIDNTICCTAVCVYNKHPDFKKNEVVNNFNESTVPF